MGKVFRKYGADSDRICTWLSLLSLLVALVCACLCARWPMLLWVPPGTIAALGIVYLFWRKSARLPDLLATALIGLCAWLAPHPYGQMGAAVAAALFVVVWRKRIADAYLPVRAYFVRKRSGGKKDV